MTRILIRFPAAIPTQGEHLLVGSTAASMHRQSLARPRSRSRNRVMFTRYRSMRDAFAPGLHAQTSRLTLPQGRLRGVCCISRAVVVQQRRERGKKGGNRDLAAPNFSVCRSDLDRSASAIFIPAEITARSALRDCAFVLIGYGHHRHYEALLHAVGNAVWLIDLVVTLRLA